MLLGFFDLFFELCLCFFSTFLIIAVFLELSSSSIPSYANLYHRCAVFLLSSFTSPLLCWHFQKASCSPVATVRQVPAPRGDSAARLHCALKSPVCFPTTHELFQDFTCALLISLIIPFPMTDSIPCTGFAALRSFCLLVQKLSLHLLLSAVATLAFCFVSQTSSVSLLSTSWVFLPSTC